MNRETWLNAIAAKMAPKFAEIGYPLPEFRVAVGFTSHGAKSNANGECWSSKCSEDGKFEILIRPDVADPLMASAILAHELTHTAVGIAEGHKGKFVAVMKAIGFTKPFTSTVPTPTFEQWVLPFLQEVGAFPHARLNFNPIGLAPILGKRKPSSRVVEGLRSGIPEEEVEEIITSAKPKQGTRLIKASCSECGYTVRVTQKWLDVGPPHCPVHGAMAAADDSTTEAETEKEE